MKKMTTSSQVVELAAPVAVQTQVIEISLELLTLSLDETRKTIDQVALQELAMSISRDGVLEPLLVRPRGLEDKSSAKGAGSMKATYEIVAGQRRLAASKLAGKATCPCIVREMSDAEAAEWRVISNLQREDLPAIEEAEAYGKLLERPGATIETVAAALAKSPSYVGRRVQLLRAIEPVRDALKAGAIEVGHALELARLDEALQRQMLTRMQCGASLVEPDDIEDEGAESGECRFCGCTEDNACAGGCSWANEEQTICTNPDCIDKFRAEIQQESTPWRKTHYSLVELRREIAETAYRDLKDAPFPLTADLAPMPCTECPKRAGNTALLFDDCAQDTCTDRPCFNRKVNAWIDAELAAAAREKRKLLKLTTSWTSDKYKVQVSDYSGARLFKTASECAHGEQGIWIDGRNAGQSAVVCRKADCKTHHLQSSRGSSSQTRQKPTAAQQSERRKVLDKVKNEKSYRAALVEAIMRAPIPATAANELNLQVCVALIGHIDGMHCGKFSAAIGWDDSTFRYPREKKLQEKLKAASQLEQLRLALLSTAATELGVHEYTLSKPEDLEKLARLLGLDPKKIREQGATAVNRPASAPVVKPAVRKAAPAKKVAAVKPAAKKSILSAAAKKRIAAAQKKRWASAKKAGRK